MTTMTITCPTCNKIHRCLICAEPAADLTIPGTTRRYHRSCIERRKAQADSNGERQAMTNLLGFVEQIH